MGTIAATVMDITSPIIADIADIDHTGTGIMSPKVITATTITDTVAVDTMIEMDMAIRSIAEVGTAINISRH